MIGIRDDIINCVGHSLYGTAYFGINSLPIEVEKGVYQIKCFCSKPYKHDEYEVKYLQFDTNSTYITLNFLLTLKNIYIKEMKFSGHYTNNPNVYIVENCGKPINITPRKYNAEKVHSLFLRLANFKIQDKPILK